MTTNTIHFSTGPNGTEILRLSKDGVWTNPDIPADDAAKVVLNALDYNIKVLVQKAVEEEREACAKLCFDMWEKWMDADPSERDNLSRDADDCAAAIRARGRE